MGVRNVSDRKLSGMNDSDFDSLLQASLPELPPDDVVCETTPWKQAMDRVVVGLALNAITLNFLLLDHILPAVGLVLTLLGFRALRRENGWLRACYAVSIVKSLYLFPTLVLNATVYQSALAQPAINGALTSAGFALTLLQFICLWRGLRAVQAKAGFPAEAVAAGALIIWYLIIAVLATVGSGGIVVGVVMVGFYVLILRGLCELSSELDEAGYAIRPAPVRVSDRALVRAIALALAVGLVCGYLFGGSYKMDWTPVPAESAETGEIKARLRELGFPEEVLDDLAEEDIALCAGALRVVVDVTDAPVNSGREVIEYEGNTEYRTTVYDEKELRITGVAVELPGERESWRIFHHFRWLTDPGFCGTESIQLWPASHSEGWDSDGAVTGRVLYTKDGAEYSAPYSSLGSRTFASRGILWGEQTSTDVFAEFSMPKCGGDKRGYVAYTAAAHYKDVRFIIDSWVNYTHQRTWVQYPALTAAEHRMSGAWNDSGAFITVQDALQFCDTDNGIELLS